MTWLFLRAEHNATKARLESVWSQSTVTDKTDHRIVSCSLAVLVNNDRRDNWQALTETNWQRQTKHRGLWPKLHKQLPQKECQSFFFQAPYEQTTTTTTLTNGITAYEGSRLSFPVSLGIGVPGLGRLRTAALDKGYQQLVQRIPPRQWWIQAWRLGGRRGIGGSHKDFLLA